ncbi:MAG: NAD-binding protein [Actinomycetes bacterium]
MGNPLLAFWHLLFGVHPDRPGGRVRITTTTSAAQASETIFLVLRRMRFPLIVLIGIFAVSVLGLVLIPGQDEAGRQVRLTFFDAFYFMSYTATTIGFGEIPRPFTPAQRMWVTFCIYLTVIGWAYAIGSVLALLQDRSFHDALELRRFTRKVEHLREPFLLLAGYGQTGRLLGNALDERGRRFVVVDSSQSCIEDLDLAEHHADVPGLVGDARDPGVLAAAGLGHPYCEGVVAITNDDQVNLAVTMAAALLHSDIPVIARTSSRSVARQMAQFGDPVVINPFDRFGDRLALALRAPSAYQLVTWLTSPNDDPCPPPLHKPIGSGRWVVCGHGRFGQEISEDVRSQGFEVTVLEPGPEQVDLLDGADVGSAVGVVAATGSDVANLSVIAAARAANPSLFLVARQNLPASSPLYDAMRLDASLVAPEIVAREALARLGHPLLWDFLVGVWDQDDAWAAALVDRLVAASGEHGPHLWDVCVTSDDAPALARRGGGVRLGDLLRDPDDRGEHLDAVPLLLVRAGRQELTPSDDELLLEGDELLLAGRLRARHVLDATLSSDASLEYVVSGRRVPSGWAWRRLTRAGPVEGARSLR